MARLWERLRVLISCWLDRAYVNLEPTAIVGGLGTDPFLCPKNGDLDLYTGTFKYFSVVAYELTGDIKTFCFF